MSRENERWRRALVVAPDGIGRRGTELLLTAYEIRVSGAACDGPGAVAILRAGVAADVVLIDLSVGDRAHSVLEHLAAAAPRLPALGYAPRGPWPIQELLDAGLRGFVLASCTPEQFVGAVRTVASGASYLDPDFAIAPLHDPHRLDRYALTERERQILGLLAHGLNGREVARQLFLSPATVRTHVQNAMRKLGARTRAQAIALASGPQDQPDSS